MELAFGAARSVDRIGAGSDVSHASARDSCQRWSGRESGCGHVRRGKIRAQHEALIHPDLELGREFPGRVDRTGDQPMLAKVVDLKRFADRLQVIAEREAEADVVIVFVETFDGPYRGPVLERPERFPLLVPAGREGKVHLNRGFGDRGDRGGQGGAGVGHRNSAGDEDEADNSSG